MLDFKKFLLEYDSEKDRTKIRLFINWYNNLDEEADRAGLSDFLKENYNENDGEYLIGELLDNNNYYSKRLEFYKEHRNTQNQNSNNYQNINSEFNSSVEDTGIENLDGVINFINSELNNIQNFDIRDRKFTVNENNQQVNYYVYPLYEMEDMRILNLLSGVFHYLKYGPI